MSFIIGLTGGIGSGKSTVAGLFTARGVALVDTDEIAHTLTAPGGGAMDAIGSTFGREFIAADGSLDRATTRRRVFAQPSMRRELEAILHPRIQEAVELALRSDSVRRAPYTILAVPLLFESQTYRQRTSRSLLVDCGTACQIQRVGRRSGLTETETHRIMAAQLPRPIRLQLADDLIWNGGAAERLAPQVDRLHGKYLAAAGV